MKFLLEIVNMIHYQSILVYNYCNIIALFIECFQAMASSLDSYQNRKSYYYCNIVLRIFNQYETSKVLSAAFLYVLFTFMLGQSISMTAKYSLFRFQRGCLGLSGRQSHAMNSEILSTSSSLYNFLAKKPHLTPQSTCLLPLNHSLLSPRCLLPPLPIRLPLLFLS